MKLGIAVSLGVIFATPSFAFDLKSPDIVEGQTINKEQVANVFGCKGGNISPALNWSGAPEGTKSFVVTLYDPDAPTGSGWWHWTVFDIPASTTEIPAGAGNAAGKGLPKGAVQGHTDFGSAGFGGPCPPQGSTHRYALTVTAVKIDSLGLDSGASGALVGYMTKANTLASATITGTYGR
jgi:Raf kinase inhibitor-like YbhB/YbcL family protein